MNEETKELLNINLIFEYYKNNNILDRYCVLFDSGRLVIDNECINILENPNEKLYITLLKKIKRETPEKLNIEQESIGNYYIKNKYGTKCYLTKHSKILADKINEILDYLESKGE